MESDIQFLALKSRISLQRYFEPTERVTLAAGVIACCPTLWPGDLLTVETTTFEQVQIGDIVLYQRSGRFFIHRVLRKSSATGSDRHSLVTRGDSMSGLPEELLGKIVSVEPSNSRA